MLKKGCLGDFDHNISERGSHLLSFLFLREP